MVHQMSKLTRWLCALVLLVACAAPHALGQRIHPNLKAGKLKVQRLVVLPADVTLIKDGMKGSEPMEKEAAVATPIIEQAIGKGFTKKQFAVLESPFKPENLQDNEKLRYALADFKRNLAELQKQMSGKMKDIEKGRFTLGDQVLLLNQDDNIDAFVLVRAVGLQKTGGKKALALITLNPLLLLPFYTIAVTLVDARTGDILAANTLYSLVDLTKADDKKLVALVEGRFKKLPAPATAAKAP